LFNGGHVCIQRVGGRHRVVAQVTRKRRHCPDQSRNATGVRKNT
jgi:hypothetical protein